MYNNNYTATQDIALHNAIQLYGKNNNKTIKCNNTCQSATMSLGPTNSSYS